MCVLCWLLRRRPQHLRLFPLVLYRRPGILCLINDVDWELEGKAEAELRDGDVIALVSTLHGG